MTSDEQQMLGQYLYQPHSWLRWPTVEADYADGKWRVVFLAMQAVVQAGLPIDTCTVHAELTRRGHEISRWELAELAENAPGTGGGILVELRRARQIRALATAGEELTRAAEHPAVDPREAAAATWQRLEAELVTTSAGDAPELADHWMAWADSLDAAPKTSVRTHFPDLDRVLRTLPRGELTLIAARPSVGKSALVTQIAWENARHGRHVLLCSAEMTAQQIVQRLASQYTGVPLERVRDGDLGGAIPKAVPLSLPKLRLCDTPGMTTRSVCETALRLHQQRPLDLIVVDHLHHLSDVAGPRESRYDQIGHMVNRLKTLAKRLDCAAIVVCQLNRHAADGKPSMAHLRDAGTLEEYANVVVLLHREPAALSCTAMVAKHRNGPTGDVELAWDGTKAQFGAFDWRSAS